MNKEILGYRPQNDRIIDLNSIAYVIALNINRGWQTFKYQICQAL
jgi:hypothetical protein